MSPEEREQRKRDRMRTRVMGDGSGVILEKLRKQKSIDSITVTADKNGYAVKMSCPPGMGPSAEHTGAGKSLRAALMEALKAWAKG